jgi:heme/copper-type cytochrome/quinol oxidase subunit 2
MAFHGVNELSRTEAIALIVIFGILVVMPISFYIYEDVLRVSRAEAQPTQVYIFAWTPEHGGWQPNEIHLKLGVKTRFIITAMDTTHSLIIEEFNVNTGHIHPGHRVEIEFIPDKEGTFTFFCGTICSAEHHFMTGKIIVER